MPVLPDQQHLPGLIHRQDADCARVLDGLTADCVPVGHPDQISPDADHGAAGELLAAQDRPAISHVRKPLRLRLAHALATERPAAAVTGCSAGLTRDRSIAAAISPLNSGCGLVGLDRNSGWAWVATKNGCTARGSSTNSTRRPSGDMPEQTRPAASRAGRYELLTSYLCRCRSCTISAPYRLLTMLPSASTAG